MGTSKLVNTVSLVFLSLFFGTSCTQTSLMGRVSSNANTASLLPSGGSTGNTGTTTTVAITEPSKVTFSAIAQNSITVNWTPTLEPAAGLESKLVKSTNLLDINTYVKADQVAEASIASPWTQGLTQKTVTGLQPSTSYYFAVLLRNKNSGKKYFITPEKATTLSLNAPVLPADSVIRIGAVSETEINLTWLPSLSGLPTATADDSEDEPILRYKVIASVAADNQATRVQTQANRDTYESELLAAIDSVAEATNTASSTKRDASDWLTNLTSFKVTGLTSGTIYAFSVLVQNEDQVIAIYPPIIGVTTDKVKPSIRNLSTFFNFSSTRDTITVKWNSAEDNLSAKADLQYRMIGARRYSDLTEAAIDGAPQTGPIWRSDWLSQSDQYQLTALPENSTFYFAAAVEDEAGNIAFIHPDEYSSRIQTVDTSSPVLNDPVIQVLEKTDSSVTLKWSAAVDAKEGEYSQDNLKYRLIRTKANPDTQMQNLQTEFSKSTYWSLLQQQLESAFEEVFAWQIPGASLTTSEENGITYYSFKVDHLDVQTANGVQSGLMYAFSLAVQDQDLHTSTYNLLNVATTDKVKPTITTSVPFTLVGKNSNAISVKWEQAQDNLSTQEKLQYRVFAAKDGTLLKTQLESFIQTNVLDSSNLIEITQNWTLASTATSGTTLTALEENTNYSIAGVVQDEAENKTLLDVLGPIKTSDGSSPSIPTQPAPLTLGGTNTTLDTLPIQWTLATDTGTDSSDLEYRIVRTNPTDAQINEQFNKTASADTLNQYLQSLRDQLNQQQVATTSAADLEQMGLKEVFGWTSKRQGFPNLFSGVGSDAVSGLIAGLKPGVFYGVTVYVRDLASPTQNYSIYPPQVAATKDTVAPVFLSGSPTVLSRTSTAVVLSFPKAKDNITLVNGLKYSIYGSATASCTTDTGSSSTMNCTVSGLTMNTSYTLNIKVEDEALNAATLPPITVTTPGKVIFATVDAFTGNLGKNLTNKAGLVAADYLCKQDAANRGLPSTSTYLALLASRAINSGPSRDATIILKPNTSYFNLDGNRIGQTNSSNLFASAFENPIRASTDTGTTEVWTGFLSTSWGTGAADCNKWQSETGFTATYGNSDQKPYNGAIWVNLGDCTGAKKLYCVEY